MSSHGPPTSSQSHLSLWHADREYVKIIQDEFSDEFSALPLHLTIEVAVGALLATAGDRPFFVISNHNAGQLTIQFNGRGFYLVRKPEVDKHEPSSNNRH